MARKLIISSILVFLIVSCNLPSVGLQQDDPTPIPNSIPTSNVRAPVVSETPAPPESEDPTLALLKKG